MKYLSVMLAALLGSIALAVPAAAAPTSGSGKITIGPKGSYGSYYWNAKTNQFRVSAHAGNLKNGYCVVTWLDLKRQKAEGEENGHLDIKVARVCKDHGDKDSSTKKIKINVIGVNKIVACYGPRNKRGSCKSVMGSVANVNPKLPNLCSQGWELRAGGSHHYWSGGDPKKCDA